MNRDNYCVIMAGGIGSRFWPLSKSSLPKQFIDIMGTGRSFIRATYDRFATFVPKENFLVVTSSQYKDLVLEHLPELNASQVLCEPLRRNTAPCIAYATYRIAAQNANANVVVTPSDHLVLDPVEFERVINEGFDFVSSNDNLLTIGIQPSRAETGYGYIQFDHQDINSLIHPVKTFTEKPSADLAEAFLSSGDFLWNSGIFIWSIGAIMAAFEKYLPQISYNFSRGADLYGTPGEQAFIDSLYPECENISIDYGVMEKSDNVFVRAGDFGWSDVGTWGSLYQNGRKDMQGNVITSGNVLAYNTNNSIISVDKSRVAVIEGLDGYLVVQKGDVLLISRLDQEQSIRNFVDDVKIKFGEKYI
ncbi:MAG: mannose-1-phosphate guanylyltransferase [Mucinivorans sp.]